MINKSGTILLIFLLMAAVSLSASGCAKPAGSAEEDSLYSSVISDIKEAIPDGAGTETAGESRSDETSETASSPALSSDPGTAAAQKSVPSIEIESIDRLEDKSLQLSWSADYDDLADGYHIMCRIINGKDGIEDWTELAYVPSGEEHIYTDHPRSGEAPTQVQYRIDAGSKDQTYAMGVPYLTSDFMICIDPGHYAGVNTMTGEDDYGYAEGDFTIKIALALRDILTEEYGIFCNMTREGDDIELYGYSNSDLDDGHLSLRGAYASEYNSDLFFSVHTNANQDDANGYPTIAQPLELAKPIILVNMIAAGSETYLNVANSVGENIARACYQEGIMTSSDFTPAAVGAVPEWTDEYNDGLNLPGAVMCRNDGEKDYYGVLRGSADEGIPGIIAEHCHHTVPTFRYKAIYEELYMILARADADGIANALGFKVKTDPSL